jgi:hypothetical protein
VWVTASGQNSNTVDFTYSDPTATPTATDTATPTQTPLNIAIIYPNPSDGTAPVRIHVPLKTMSDVKIKVYTTGFRKVQEMDYSALTSSDSEVTLPLWDKWGTGLANGLYYVEVETQQGLFRNKWLILR